MTRRPANGDAVPQIRHIAAVAVGNALEFYDFLTFSFFAVPISHVFFPAGDESTALLKTLATFMVGFLTRPLGGLVIGMFSDRHGRRPAMLLSIALMGLSISGLALTPSYASIGVAAPILIVAFRMIQGFALGGEVGPSTAFLIEVAPSGRRGFYVSLQLLSQQTAVLGAGIVGVVLASLLDAAALEAWGWRLAFLIGLGVVPVGLVLRRSLPETIRRRGRLEPGDWRAYGRIAILGVMMLTAGTVGVYVNNYLNTFAIDTLKMAPSVGFGATTSGAIGTIIGMFLSGRLCDHVGRRQVMIPGTIALLAAVLPVFLAIIELRSPLALYAGTAVLGFLIGTSTPPVLVSITESLPARIRAGALSVIYALAISIFGGSTQFAVKWLIVETGSPYAPAWYLMGALAIGLAAMLVLEETAGLKASPARPAEVLPT